MAGIQYVTLLRGINVGGKNIVKMTDLKTYFEKMGFTEVVSYIQSGNILFKSPNDVLYCSRLISKATQSHISKIVSCSFYKKITMRNWNTTSKLLSLMHQSNDNK